MEYKIDWIILVYWPQKLNVNHNKRLHVNYPSVPHFTHIRYLLMIY